jgi:hypothetical protein
MIKKIKKESYAMLQLPKEVHSQLKEFCEERGYKMSRFVSNLIKEKVRTVGRPKNVLPVSRIEQS